MVFKPTFIDHLSLVKNNTNPSISKYFFKIAHEKSDYNLFLSYKNNSENRLNKSIKEFKDFQRRNFLLKYFENKFYYKIFFSFVFQIEKEKEYFEKVSKKVAESEQNIRALEKQIEMIRREKSIQNIIN